MGIANHAHHARRTGAAVLVVDDDPGALESTGLVLRSLGLVVRQAATGAAACSVARAHPLDLAVLDYRLPDGTGLEVASALRVAHVPVRWILVSGFMDFDVAAEAGRRGALRAVSSPYDVEAVVLDALARVEQLRGTGWPQGPVYPHRLREPRSGVEACACSVWRGCDSADDIRTIHDWAHAAGKGYSTLRGLCRQGGIDPEAGKDFARILRALFITRGRVAEVALHLRSWDPRTVGPLLDRAGLGVPSTPAVLTFDEFLIVQRFVGQDDPLLTALRNILVTD